MTEKLIRDRIPDLARIQGQELPVRSCRQGEMDLFLRAKLVEEAEEAANSGPRELLMELADLSEVITALLQEYGWSRADLEREQARKRHLRGGFTEGYVLRTREN